jgi:hypothetical protein
MIMKMFIDHKEPLRLASQGSCPADRGISDINVGWFTDVGVL